MSKPNKTTIAITIAFSTISNCLLFNTLSNSSMITHLITLDPSVSRWVPRGTARWKIRIRRVDGASFVKGIVPKIYGSKNGGLGAKRVNTV